MVLWLLLLRLVVIAQVVEAPKGPVMCGTIANVGVVKLAVIEVKAGRFQGRDLAVEFMCPEALKEGEVLRVVVEKKRKGGFRAVAWRVLRH